MLATETVKRQIKKEGGFAGTVKASITASLIAPMVSLLLQPTASSLINTITGTGARRARKGQEGEFCPFLTLVLIIKVLAKGVMDKHF